MGIKETAELQLCVSHRMKMKVHSELFSLGLKLKHQHEPL